MVLFNYTAKNLSAKRAHSNCAPKARSDIINRCALRSVLFGFRARFYILRLHISLFLVIFLYLNSSQFYNIIDVNYIFTKLLNFFISNKKGNSIYLLSKSESVKFSQSESVICLFTDSEVKKYISLFNQLIITD